MSWGAAPSDTKGNTLHPAPSVVRLVMLGVGMHDDAVAELHMRTDHAERTDLDIRPEFRAWIDQGGRMNFDHARPD